METNDIVTKNFEAYADVAADIINVLLYEGRKEVRDHDVFAAATESLYIDQEKGLRSQLEDVAKYHVVDGKTKTMYLLSNQSKVDKGMVLRKAGYVGGEYRRQYEKQNVGLYPVIEIVLYWGKNRWKGACSLHQLLEEELSDTVRKYVDNIQLHVWEMRYLPAEIREHFQSDMRIIVDYLAEGNSYRSNRKVIHKEATIKMLRVLAGDKNVDDTGEVLKEMDIKEEDEIRVCELFDQYTRRGREEGVRGVIKVCKEFNVSYQEAMNKICEVFQMPKTEAQKKLKLYW